MTAEEMLKLYFGYDTFKQGQKEIIDSILTGRDALAIMPTGAGKSICYQIPAMMLQGITLVVSPLISLMQDQVKILNEAGVHAAYINSSLTNIQISKALNLAANGRYKIIYVAPERLETEEFLDFAIHAQISMVTVDEAHCISQWGQDFRPSYLKIVQFIEKLSSRPIISAFTATATGEVKEDILSILNLVNPKVVITGFDRPNLYFKVEHTRKKDDFVSDYIETNSEDSGIIYCATRKNVDNLYNLLLEKGVSVTRYHAGMDNEIRKKNQDDFIYDRKAVMIATNAFGMGIDKSNVRYVIHYNMPQSMENYYQEAGRVGRDGESAQCILLFSAHDIIIDRYLLENKDFSGLSFEETELVRQRDNKRLLAMEGYCRTTGCLRNYILNYFGEQSLGPCDNCGNCDKEYREIDMTAEAKQIINCVAETKGRYGIGVVLGILAGASTAKLRKLKVADYQTYGILKDCSRQDISALIYQMISDGYLYQTENQYCVLKIGDISPLRDESTCVIIRTYEEQKPTRTNQVSVKGSRDSLTELGQELFETLRKLRMDIAKEESLPPYIIFNDKALIDMCIKLPLDETAFLNVSGVGTRKLEKYGRKFLEVINTFVNTHYGEMTNLTNDIDVKEKSFDRAEFSGHRDRPASAGASWNEEEVTVLEHEFKSGIPISEIARMHSRTIGAIAARLKKDGLIE